jgi:hypothetical protein
VSYACHNGFITKSIHIYRIVPDRKLAFLLDAGEASRTSIILEFV